MEKELTIKEKYLFFIKKTKPSTNKQTLIALAITIALIILYRLN